MIVNWMLIAVVLTVVWVITLGVNRSVIGDIETDLEPSTPLGVSFVSGWFNMLTKGSPLTALFVAGLIVVLLGMTVIPFLVGLACAVAFHYIHVALLKGSRTPAIVGEFAVVVWTCIILNS